MHPELRVVAEHNGGVFLRRDAVNAGYSERQLKTLTGHRGEWAAVRRGVYAERSLLAQLDDDARYALSVRAAALTSTRDAVTSHAGAAALHEMPMRPRWRDVLHLTRPDVRGGRTENGIKHHRGLLRPEDVVLVHGLPVTSLARTAVDLAREHGFEDGVVACDAALRMGATREALLWAVENGRCWPHNARARQAVAVADGGAETIGESLLRLLVLELDIGVPETQYAVSEGGRTAYADLRVGRHLFEFDGRVKYVERGRGGVADRPLSQVLWEEKRREDWMRTAAGGHGMSRVVWEELFGHQRRLTKRRLHAEYRTTERRFGPAGEW